MFRACNSGATMGVTSSSGAGPASSSKASSAAKGSTGGGGGAVNSCRECLLKDALLRKMLEPSTNDFVILSHLLWSKQFVSKGPKVFIKSFRFRNFHTTKDSCCTGAGCVNLTCMKMCRKWQSIKSGRRCGYTRGGIHERASLVVTGGGSHGARPSSPPQCIKVICSTTVRAFSQMAKWSTRAETAWP